MNKILGIIFIILFIQNPAFCKNTEKLDSFIDLGNYIETNKEQESSTPSDLSESYQNFEEEAITDLMSRYKQNEVMLNLEDEDKLTYNPNLFKLQVNEIYLKPDKNIQNNNMIWDTSKSFSHALLSNSRHMAPIPSVINSQTIQSQVSPSVSASLGQTYLFNSLDTSVLFVRGNESTYNTGSVLSYKGSGLNLSVGSFNSSYNNTASGGAILKSNPLKLPNQKGNISIGSAFFTNENQEYYKSTGGLFSEYSYKRLTLSAQVGQSRYSNSSFYDTSLYFTPEYKITDSISLKTRLIRNITKNTMQDEMAITYKPKNHSNNLEFEINASNQYDRNSTIKQRLKFSTSFRI